MTSKVCATPFVKWAGGKRQILKSLVPNVPVKYRAYHEPFVGGGALFFALRPQVARLSDINNELMLVYRVIKNDADALISDLRKHRNTERYYYRLRNADRSDAYNDWSDVRKASRFIFLNKTCFNGLYRQNAQGYFNVPFGFYKQPKIVDEEKLRACSATLKRTRIGTESFLAVEKTAGRGDFIYFDPPYAPVSKTASFTQYFKQDFNTNAQVELKRLCDRLAKRNIRFMVSNSHTPLVLKLYHNYRKNMEVVTAKRAINCQGQNRKGVKEVIIKNF